MKNNEIVFDTDLLRSEYKSEYWKIIGDLSKFELKGKLNEILYIGLGGLVSLSQIAEYAFKSYCDLYELLDKKLSDEDLDLAFNYVLENIENNDSILVNELTFGKIFTKLSEIGIIDIEYYNKHQFIVKNRNIFIHHYFIVNPKTLRDTKNVKSIIKEIYFTFHMFQQIINDVNIFFKDKTMQINSNLQLLLEKIGKLYVGS